MNDTRVTLESLYDQFKRILLKHGFSEDKADTCARIFTDNTRDGVLSHGINRFPKFVDFVRRGIVKPDAEPELVNANGAFERWDGHQGPGPLNARFCMDRAINLAQSHAIGCVGLRNTNHWMRGGTYGLQAADAGCIGICWTNTMVLMPPWGSREARLGNNPLVLCVPNKPDHILLDTAMSQFSFGRLANAQRSAEKLPVPGGFDANGNLTDDPGEIMRSKQPLPIGYWKGSGMVLLLDCMVSVLSAGNATFQIGEGADETNISQAFIAIDVSKIGGAETAASLVPQILDDLHSANPTDPASPVTFPGERTSQRRAASAKNGVVVDAAIWQKIQAL
jgi:3-dehydro-L-gulonate 2-dehydrogenase